MTNLAENMGVIKEAAETDEEFVAYRHIVGAIAPEGPVCGTFFLLSAVEMHGFGFLHPFAARILHFCPRKAKPYL